MPVNPRLTLDRVHRVLSYDPTTGLFVWRVSLSGRGRAGQRAGVIHKRDGYRIITIDGEQFRAGRLAWFYVNGRWPQGLIDHENTVRSDDRFDNLREATDAQNSANSKGYAASGLKGSYFNKNTGRWFSNIRQNGKLTSLGTFDSAEEAHAAWVNAAREEYGEFVRAA